MPRDRDEESGEYVETYPEEDFIKALEKLSGAAGTQEVADEVGCAYRTAHQKLTILDEQGDIDSRKVGNALLWLLSDDG